MNNSTLKKWIFLTGLLLLTLLLVWQAPEPEQTEVVQATQPPARSQPARAATSVIPGMADEELKLKPRQPNGQVVNLFAVPVKPKPVKPAVIQKPVKVQPPPKRVELPFRYVGRLQSTQKQTLFLMEGNQLYLVQEGDTVNQAFRLQRIDDTNKELVWLYLPSKETRKMSMDQ